MSAAQPIVRLKDSSPSPVSLAISGEDPAIDLVHLARQTDGDDALEAELLEMFDRQSAKTMARFLAPDLSGRARADLAHRLRGSALAIGAWRVAQAALAVEKENEALGEGAREAAATLEGLDAAVEEARASIAELRS